jgi:hypothetical protein
MVKYLVHCVGKQIFCIPLEDHVCETHVLTHDHFYIYHYLGRTCARQWLGYNLLLVDCWLNLAAGAQKRAHCLTLRSE